MYRNTSKCLKVVSDTSRLAMEGLMYTRNPQFLAHSGRGRDSEVGLFRTEAHVGNHEATHACSNALLMNHLFVSLRGEPYMAHEGHIGVVYTYWILV